MIKRLILILSIFIASLNSSPVIDIVEELVDKDSFRQHRLLINKIFENEKRFMSGDEVKIISVLTKLKNNGILKLFLNKPQSIQISFKGGGNPIFFMKLISDSLQDLGYFKYRVLEATRDSNGFLWTIEFRSDYILDPTLLYSSLAKKGCRIVEINRNALLQWSYSIDTTDAILNATKVVKKRSLRLKTPVFDYWLQIEKDSKNIEFTSIGNRWHPYIAFYDKNLFLIKLFKDDKKRTKLNLKIPENSEYLKVTDIYLLNNIKNGLRVKLR